MTPERMRQYGKGLGLWQDKRLATAEPISYLRKDHPISVTPVAQAQGCWLESTDDSTQPVNPLANGVFLWTEIIGAGHAFVSVHQDNNPYVYTYGRFGRTGGSLGAVGDGVLNFFQFGDARTYYQTALYGVSAKAFRIDDADPGITRAYFERLWKMGTPAIPTPTMGDMTRRGGHTIDQYDVTGKNCTTHATDGLKMAGSGVFQGGYTTHSQMRVESEEDFAVPLSLQRYLMKKSAEPSMLVVDMTSEFRRQYPNTDGVMPANEDNPDTRAYRAMAEAASALGTVSPYSGGTVGGLLGGENHVSK
ncbi:hypothetical protein KAM448_42060 [Aeromonas caviae]|uniref:Uncharacterized protein n=2 Tax=Aeromonas caviae TaxID=648 RepID=A0ABD0BDG6_AERCA|nr:hypothetical protein KAM355_42300 [Aeromonas caviae]GJB13339.1 hypothetical protein KAM362_38990 [Aeromonas caviae]GJB26500.1 hypothetical protein KAM365_42500 [Aeromonas caviae]GJB35132.1 hypothetical protein KAM367_42340 [Aeromonas caviae]GJB43841.1 hypothetical protein KAM369_43160 [Aeromonas caviae]